MTFNPKVYIQPGQFPWVLWTPQNTQNRCPIRPIISRREVVTYGVSKEFANIIQPLVDQSPYHIKNTLQFINHNKSVQLVSYFVKTLFTSVPVNPAINIVQSRLQQDPFLSQSHPCPSLK